MILSPLLATRETCYAPNHQYNNFHVAQGPIDGIHCPIQTHIVFSVEKKTHFMVTILSEY